MKKNAYSKGVRLSLMAAILLGSNAYAGKIIGVDANASYVETTPLPTQHGFGGWNFGNVEVFITDLNYTDLVTKTFNEEFGTYDSMDMNDTFESQITTGGEHRANLHGKDWPVGEPAGIKIINGDMLVKHGKPENCIMTSSYQEFQIDDDNTSGTGYLDAFSVGLVPRPVICSSDFQTHKRFKVNLLETTVDNIAEGEGGYGKPVDLVFNLDLSDTSTEITRYEVLQKINNYTDKRLDGYKIEILDFDGQKNANLTLSIGEDEGDANDDGIIDGDIWEVSELANMSHGLWGPIQKDRFDNGFFDYIRVYYPVTLSPDKQTISYAGPMQGGNYQQIFGNWLPSIWEPTGMFFDDDNDPLTDAVLQAFYGVAPGETELAWWKRTVENPYGTTPIYHWEKVTVADMAEWSGNPLYAAGPVEDVLNLGLNYIVNIGSNAAITGGKFIIRITPHVDTNQIAPLYVGETPPSNYTSSEGEVAITPEPIFAPGTKVAVSVGDFDLNLDEAAIDEANVTVRSDLGDEENLTLIETDVNSSVFTAKLETGLNDSFTKDDGNLSVMQDTNVTVTYIDHASVDGTDVPRVASTIAHTVVKPTADAGSDVTVTEGQSVTIVGTGTVDKYSDYTYYEWKDKATKKVIATTASFDTLTSHPVGTYTLTFKVSDVFGMSDTDDLNITVVAAEDTTPPIIAEVTAVNSPTSDSTPAYTFSSDENGTITYGGSCASSVTDAIIGDNTISFNALSDGTYSDCTITVTDAASNASLPLTVTGFVVATDATIPDDTGDVTLPTGSSDGGSCTFNPNSKGVDTTVLLMLALGMFYPFRRRFIK